MKDDIPTELVALRKKVEQRSLAVCWLQLTIFNELLQENKKLMEIMLVISRNIQFRENAQIQ